MPVSFSLVGGAAAQFLDNNGNPLAAGKLYTYTAGTSTPQTTYTTSAGTIAHSNPIVLDAGGRVPYGEIWGTSGVAYKFLLQDSASNLIATWDNVPTTSSALNGTGTNNAVPYFNSSGVFTSGSNLTFNGTDLTAAGALNSATLTTSGNATITGTIASTGGITSATPAVTQAASDNSTKIATTAFVKSYAPSAKIQPLSVAQTSPTGGLIFTLNPTYLDFRSTTATSGTVTSVDVPSAITLTLPSGTALGATSGSQTRLVILAIYNSGNVILAVNNISGGLNLDETSTITTTNATGGSTAATVFSSANVTSSYRVVGFVDVTNTSGSWGTPAKVQGSGGQALAAMSSLGYGQTYYALNSGTTPSRTLSNTTTQTYYYNTYGKPMLFIMQAYGADNAVYIYLKDPISGGAVVITSGQTGATGNDQNCVTAIVPPGWGYAGVAQYGTVSSWYFIELR